MHEFNFQIKRKVTTWINTDYIIDAETEEEANEKIKVISEDQHTDFAEECQSWYDNDDSDEVLLTPDQNNGKATFTVTNKEGDLILSNLN